MYGITDLPPVYEEEEIPEPDLDTDEKDPEDPVENVEIVDKSNKGILATCLYLLRLIILYSISNK